MEFQEIQSLWEKSNEVIVKNTKINKQLLKNMLTSKPIKIINWLLYKRYLEFILGIILVITFIFKVKLRSPSNELYAGLTLLIILLMITFYRMANYILLLRNIDLTSTLIDARKNVLQAQKYHYTTKKIEFVSPILSFIALKMVLPINTLMLDFNKLPIILCFIIFFMIWNFKKNSTQKVFEEIKKDLREIEELEKI